MNKTKHDPTISRPLIRAVIFDLGGVVLGSPLHAIASFERELGIPAGFVNRVVVDTGASGAWARHERGELAREHFLELLGVLKLSDAAPIGGFAAVLGCGVRGGQVHLGLGLWTCLVISRHVWHAHR